MVCVTNPNVNRLLCERHKSLDLICGSQPHCLSSGVEGVVSSFISQHAWKVSCIITPAFSLSEPPPPEKLLELLPVFVHFCCQPRQSKPLTMTDLSELNFKSGQPELTLPDWYQYEPLPSHEHTRVLVLEPGPNNSDNNVTPLVGSLRLFDLCDKTLEPFEAISYVWGPRSRTHVILIGGRPLPITASLRNALLQTRLPDRPRTLWADAICIDQSDRTEKGHQVAAMGRIYRKSRRTLICLGVQHPEAARKTARLIGKVNAMIENIQQMLGFSGAKGSFPYPATTCSLVNDPLWESGWNFMLEQPWFKRGWVVQEASLGPDADILWASVHIGWDSVLRVNYWLKCRGRFVHRARDTKVPSDLSIHHLYNFACRHPEEALLFDRNVMQASTASTLTMLFETRSFELSDPRDRIYAFMGLDTTDGFMLGLQLEPDYNRPHLDIYREFAVQYIKKTGDLSILSYVKHNEESLAKAGRRTVSDRPATPKSMPSWIPRWDLGRSLMLPFQTKQIDRPKEFMFREGGSVLGVRGLILGSVEYSTRQELSFPPGRADLISRGLLLLWKDVTAQSFPEDGPYSGREAFAFFDLLCPRRQFSTFKEWSASRADFVHMLQSTRQQQENVGHAPGKVKTLAERIRRRGPRRFVILSRGYYGIAPPVAQNGDAFALIYGTKTLSLLRPIEDRPGHYTIVGPIYVESKMVLDPHGSNQMGKGGRRRDWEEWNLTEEDINLC